MDLKAGAGERPNSPIAVERVNCGIADEDRLSRILAKRRSRVLTKVVEQTAGDLNFIAARAQVYGYSSHNKADQKKSCGVAISKQR